jgi:hypothetical protein
MITATAAMMRTMIDDICIVSIANDRP